ncbi:MAG TPA: hypothetical protein VII50_09945 [Acidothermaceae bacterium]
MTSLTEIRDGVLRDMPRKSGLDARETTQTGKTDEQPTVARELALVPGLVIEHPSGKTTLTVPAQRIMAAAEAEKWLLRIQGRFVGSEAPNRNGAMWSADDLMYGLPTVASGPLNWLHSERKVVGCIASAGYVDRQTAAGVVTAPHLQAQSVMWRWLYPEECRIAERAADNNALWYSMECVSENVECSPTAGGCGAKFPYATYMRERAKTCEHMMSGSAPRRFENPIFQGGAIIVPPIRPGWADADAEVVRTAAAAADGLDAADFSLETSDLTAMLQQVASWQKAG